MKETIIGMTWFDTPSTQTQSRVIISVKHPETWDTDKLKDMMDRAAEEMRRALHN